MGGRKPQASRVFRNRSRSGWLLGLGLVLGILAITAISVRWSTETAEAQANAGFTPQTTTVWAPLGFGLNGIVRAVAVNGTDLYVDGDFTAICGNATCDSGNIPAHRVAKWDGHQWAPLGFGLGVGANSSIAIHNDQVYVAGALQICSDADCASFTKVQGLAVWNGSSWSAPFPPLTSNTGCCTTLAFLGNDLYVGGPGFINTGPNPEDLTCAIGKLSGGAWVPAPGQGLWYKASPQFGLTCGSNGTQGGAAVISLLAVGNDLYVGGFFTQAGGGDAAGTTMDLNNIAVLRGGTTWQALPGKGVIAAPNFNGVQTGSVNSMGVNGSDVFAGGAFIQTFDGSLNPKNIVQYSSGAAFPLPNTGLNGQVVRIGMRGADLFAIGSFNATADGSVTGLGTTAPGQSVNSDGVAWLNNGTWSRLGNGFLWPGHSAGAVLLGIAVSDTKVYVGGGFTQNGDNSAAGMNNIAQLLPVVTTQLEMTKTVDKSQAIVGENLTYTISIKNKGPEIANAVTLNDPLPNNVTFVSVSSTQGTCSQSSGPVICNIGDLANGATATATIVVTPNAAGTIANTATVSAANANSVQGQASSNASPASSTVQFSAAAVNVGEADGHVNVTVTRSGDTTAAATVDYATSDPAGSNKCNVVNGAASSRCDYLTTLGTLHFAAGETSKVIPISVVDDAYAEGNETFAITLSNALGNGMGLGAPVKATITIIDNDAANGLNPSDNSTFFVRLHYLDFLNREPDQSGLDFWTNNINNCSPQPSCTDVQRINTSGAFFLSIEFQQTGYLVYRAYKTSFGNLTSPVNAPVPVRFNEFLSDTQEIGNGVIVNQGNWQQQLEANKQAFTLEFVQRSRFTTAFSTTLTPAQFVDQMFTNAGVTPSTSDRNAAINEFGSASNTNDVNARSRALRDVAENALLQQQEFNRAFVLMQYFGYLRRNPNDSPDSDYGGFNFWLTKLNQFNGNYQNAEMVKAFITSPEYRGRFGP